MDVPLCANLLIGWVPGVAPVVKTAQEARDGSVAREGRMEYSSYI